jgi:hypothetical protein
MPYSPLSNNEEALELTWFKSMLIQRKPAAEPVGIESGRFTYFVKFFHSQLPSPLQYVGAFTVRRADPVAALFPVVAAHLGFPRDTAFLVFEETASGPLRRMASPQIAPSATWVAALIFQLPPGAPLPQTSYPWAAASLAQTEEAVAEASDGLPFVRHEGTTVETVNLFLLGAVDAVLFRYENPSAPIARISFGTGLTVIELQTFIARVLGVQFNPTADSLLLFKADMANSQIPISSSSPGEVAYQFSQKKLHRILARYVPSVPEGKLRSLIDLAVAFSEDGYFITRSTQVFFPAMITVSQVRQFLINSNFIPDVPNLRFLLIWSQSIESVVKDLDTQVRRYRSMRLDLVPPDQVNLPPRSLLVQSARVHEDFSVVGLPFLFVLRLAEPVSDLAVRIRTALHLTEAERLFLSNTSHVSSFAACVELIPGKTVEACLAGEPARDPRLFVLKTSATVRRARSRDESVRI